MLKKHFANEGSLIVQELIFALCYKFKPLMPWLSGCSSVSPTPVSKLFDHLGTVFFRHSMKREAQVLSSESFSARDRVWRAPSIVTTLPPRRPAVIYYGEVQIEQ